MDRKMNKFLGDDEFLTLSIVSGTPGFEEQKERYLKQRGFNIRTCNVIGSELFWFVLPELTELEKHHFLQVACDEGDAEAFVALGGDSKYVEENDYVNFDISVNFYCDLFQMGKLDLDYFLNKTEGKGKHDAMSLAYLFASMLREIQRRKG